MTTTRKTLTLKTPIKPFPVVVKDEYPKKVTPARNKKQPLKPQFSFLYNNWPQVFRKDSKLPLKLGILEDIIADIKARELPMSTTKLRALMWLYCNKRSYNASFFVNDVRYDLEGKPTDQALTLEAKQQAFSKIKARLKQKGKWDNWDKLV